MAERQEARLEVRPASNGFIIYIKGEMPTVVTNLTALQSKVDEWAQKVVPAHVRRES